MELNNSYIEKSIFFISNIIIINFLTDKKLCIFFLIWLFIILIIKNKDSLKRIILFFVPAALFIIPLIFIHGLGKGIHGIYFEVEYEFLFKNIISIVAMIVYITSISFKEFCFTLKKIKMPNYLIEIVIYMQKFVNMMFNNYKEYTLAYRCRCGKIRLKKFSEIVVAVFKNSFHDLQEMKVALYSRGYFEAYKLIPKRDKISYIKLTIYIAYIFITINLQK